MIKPHVLLSRQVSCLAPVPFLKQVSGGVHAWVTRSIDLRESSRRT